MALRVLLADESVTIKKVFQVALQDFAVEVISVPVGVDVIPVALKSKPDIIFADVILQKKNGYEVTHEIKSHPELAQIPVVLIWSGFMELDREKFKSSLANDDLEKPFDTQRLRAIIQGLVPKTRTQPLSPYLTFPKLPEFTDGPSLPPIPLPAAQVKEAKTASTAGSWNMENFTPLNPMDEELPEDFLTVELPPEPPRPSSKKSNLMNEEPDENNNQWVQKTLSSYKLNLNAQSEEPAVKYKIPDEDEVFELDLSDQTQTKTEPPEMTKSTSLTSAPLQQLDEKQLEAIIRAQAKEVIEKVVWQIVPEIATQIIERELARLIKERKEL